MSRRFLFLFLSLFTLALVACSGSATPQLIASYPNRPPSSPPQPNTILVYNTYLELDVAEVTQAASQATQIATGGEVTWSARSPGTATGACTPPWSWLPRKLPSKIRWVSYTGWETSPVSAFPASRRIQPTVMNGTSFPASPSNCARLLTPGLGQSQRLMFGTQGAPSVAPLKLAVPS